MPKNVLYADDDPGLRRLVDSSGRAIEAPIAFLAYRDGRRTTDYLAEKPDVFAARVPKDATVIDGCWMN